MLNLIVAIQVAVTSLIGRVQDDERGQTTAEYVLMLLGAAAVAMLVVAWATKTGKITSLLDQVMDSITSKVS